MRSTANLGLVAIGAAPSAAEVAAAEERARAGETPVSWLAWAALGGAIAVLLWTARRRPESSYALVDGRNADGPKPVGMWSSDEELIQSYDRRVEMLG